MARIRIGTVGYLNAAPLTSHLDPERYEVVAAHPRAIAAALRSGDVAVALAPVAAVLSDGDFRIVPAVCVGADGEVASVVLVAETPPESWTEVVLDGSSRTSQTLARLVLTQGPLASVVRADLVITEGEVGDGPKRVGGTVAALVIGDPARTLPPHLERWDLATLWKQWTGQPFVFAVWAGQPDLDPAIVADLVAAGQAGVAAIGATYTGDDLDYLTRNIRFTLDDAALIGLRRYAALAWRAGLIGTEDVVLYGPASRHHDVSVDVDAVLDGVLAGARLDDEDAVALLASRRDTSLSVAAHLARQARHGQASASYLVERRVPAEVVASGDAAFVDAVGEAAAEGASVVHLLGLSELPHTARLARLGVVRAAGLQGLGLDVRDVAADQVGELADAGLAALRLRVDGGALADDVVEAAAEADLDVHAVIDVDASLDDEALVARLSALRALQDATGAVVAVSVDAPLPVGALVEPGKPTPSRWLRCLSLARLFLDGVPHVSASPGLHGLDASQAALFAGADDLGAVGEGPVVVAPGAAAFATPLASAERALRVAGLDAVRRDARFHEVGGPLTQLRKVRPVSERARLA